MGACLTRSCIFMGVRVCKCVLVCICVLIGSHRCPCLSVCMCVGPLVCRPCVCPHTKAVICVDVCVHLCICVTYMCTQPFA